MLTYTEYNSIVQQYLSTIELLDAKLQAALADTPNVSYLTDPHGFVMYRRTRDLKNKIRSAKYIIDLEAKWIGHQLPEEDVQSASSHLRAI